MSDGKMFRWYTDEEITHKMELARDKAIDLAVRAILSMDPHIYDEDTIRAAAQAACDILKGKP
jgi:hypothetical protein